MHVVFFADDQTKDIERQANSLKEEGNKAFREQEFSHAVELYTKALHLNQTSIYYANRSVANLMNGSPQEALSDANKAIGLDKDDVQSFVRRADAYWALGSYERALEDYTRAHNFKPSNSLYMERVEECNKILRQK